MSAKRGVIVEAGYFIDFWLKSEIHYGYILQVSTSALKVAYDEWKVGYNEISIPLSDEVLIPIQEMLSPQFRDWRFEYFIELLRNHGDYSLFCKKLQHMRSLMRVSEEMFVQFHYRFHRLFAHLAWKALLPDLRDIVPIWMDYLEEKQHSQRGVLLDEVWPAFRRYLRSILSYSLERAPAQTLQILQEFGYFELILDLLEKENCATQWILYGAEFVLVHHSVFPLYLSRVLVCYRKSTVQERIEDLWLAGLDCKPSPYPFLSILYLLKRYDEANQFCRDFIATTLSSQNPAIKRSGLRELLQVTRKSPRCIPLCVESSEIVLQLSHAVVDPKYTADVTALFASMSAKNLCTLLTNAESNFLDFMTMEVLCTLIERRKWTVLRLLASLGLRFSSLPRDLLPVIVRKCVYKKIEASLFRMLIDFSYLPEPETYELIYQRHTISRRMQILSVLNFSHVSQIGNLVKLRLYAEVRAMIMLHSLPSERLRTLWIASKIQFLKRLPQGLLRSIVAEFAY